MKNQNNYLGYASDILLHFHQNVYKKKIATATLKCNSGNRKNNQQKTSLRKKSRFVFVITCSFGTTAGGSDPHINSRLMS